MIPITYRRLLTRGDLTDSAGGLYNPGVYQEANGAITLLVRHEVDYTWTQPARVSRLAWLARGPQIDVMGHGDPLSLSVVGFNPSTRIEDCRPFLCHDQILVAHVAYRPRSQEPVRQRLSRLIDGRIERHDDWALPVPATPVEKNWVLLERDGTLYCVYSLDPLWIFERTPSGRWTQVVSTVTGLTKAFGKPLRNSTHLLPFSGGYLGFWHYILDRSYVTGAYWLDQHLQLGARTGILIDGSWVQGEDVYKPGVCYVSSAIQRGDDLLLFYGEGDSHSGVATLSVADLRRVLR